MSRDFDRRHHQQPYYARVFTRADLRDLYDLAGNYCSNSFSVCNWLYRDKPRAYYDEIFDSNSMMTAYVKDNSGDPRSPINGRLSGLFFMADSVRGKPPWYSFFGNRRFQVPPSVLFDAAPNIYFADFYCLRGCRHYVSLVMATPHSPADNFCRRRLIRVHWDDNPFFHWMDDRMYVNDTEFLHVEFFYTRDVDVIELVDAGTARLSYVQARGRGGSSPDGIPKNPGCAICNL